MIKTICKLFYRMDMLYLIINKKTTFYLKRWALGGLAYIYSLCTPPVSKEKQIDFFFLLFNLKKGKTFLLLS